MEKCRCRKVCSLITPTFLNRLDTNNAVMLCSMSSCWIKKVTTVPIKLPDSIVDETWEILTNSINFHRKEPMKKGSLVNNSYIFGIIFILSTLVSSAVYPLFKCKRLEESYKASRVYSRWNMSNFKKNYINSLEECRCRKVCSLITPTFLIRLDSNTAVMLCSMPSCKMLKLRQIRWTIQSL